jgi:predicted TIM-barrel fold metal-dependent hydrolase
MAIAATTSTVRLTDMRLPEDAPLEIVDPFVQYIPSGTEIEVPMPRELLRDEASLAAWPSTAVTGHVFRKDPDRAERDAIASDLSRWLDQLDTWRIARAGIPLLPSTPNEVFDRLSDHADRVFVSVRANPHDGMKGISRIAELASAYPIIKAVSLSPFMAYPLIPPNSKEYYPIYAKCVELDLAVFVNVGFPGPRVPAAAADPIHLDEVCWFFEDLRVVMRHGGVPWVSTCVQMLLRWPNLYYATTAFAPKHYPSEIIHFLNTRGTSKVMYAGYFPILSFDRIFAELSELPLRLEVLPRFLALNAIEAFRLS